jgi:hypothetical protein
VGCLSGLVLLVGFVALILALVFGLIRSSDAYQQALAKARSSPAAAQVLGSPITEGYFTSGQINVNGASGNADLAIPVSGPKGKATLHVTASKSAGVWSFSTLVVELADTHERIDLLEGHSQQ